MDKQGTLDRICTFLWLFFQGKVYIAGGFNGTECLSSAECYSPATNQWTIIQGMRNRRSGVGVISHDGCIFAIGGFNGITRMNNGEKYNPRTNQWTTIAEMYSPRSNFGIEVNIPETEENNYVDC